jgi:hypothetical protein
MAADDPLTDRVFSAYRGYYDAIVPFSRIADQAVFELRELTP